MTLFDIEPVARQYTRADRHSLGAVYTPPILARWVVSLLRDVAQVEVHTVLDPACGNAALLEAARDELPNLSVLVGLDVSVSAVEASREKLAGETATLLTKDALTTNATDLPQVDAVIMNPPWGSDLSAHVTSLRQGGYTLTSGQFDSWDLFVEWTIRTLPAGTPVAAILPDSLFLPEHSATRRLLLDRTRLHVVARLGEGWFEHVFRGVAVLAYTIGEGTTEPIRTVRIDHAARRRVLRRETNLADEAEQVSQSVAPQPWVSDPNARFRSIGSDSAPWHTAVVDGKHWTDWFQIGRGVEMGASGNLFRCEHCGWHRGPSRRASDCKNCGQPTTWTPVQAITTKPVKESVPLIIGRDVHRYEVEPSRWLRLGLTGVSYKDPDLYRHPKLLVRKTGLGLNVAVDRTGSHTNQVVFHYVPRRDAPAWAMHYVEGVLCSRVMLATYLSLTGETEWRSHPYVTPKVLATLPVPVPSDEYAVAQARAICDAVVARHRAPDAQRDEHELRVDNLVAGLYGLDTAGCAWVEQTLARTQALDAFAHTRSAATLTAVVA